MSEEKRNKSTRWINELNNLDHLPVESSLDKSKAWDKLSVRIEKKPAARKMIWYSAAAAILVIASFLFLNRQEEREHETAKQLVKQASPASQLSGNTDTITKIILPSITVNEEKKHKTLFTKKIRNRVSEKKDVIPVPAIAGIHLQRETPEINFPQYQQPLAISSTLPVKKKLRVVHNNLLGQPIESSPVPHGYTSAYSESRPFNNEMQSGLTVGRNASDNFLKIKISPSN